PLAKPDNIAERRVAGQFYFRPGTLIIMLQVNAHFTKGLVIPNNFQLPRLIRPMSFKPGLPYGGLVNKTSGLFCIRIQMQYVIRIDPRLSWGTTDSHIDYTNRHSFFTVIYFGEIPGNSG